MKTSLLIAFTHTAQAVVKLEPEKNLRMNAREIQTHDLCDIGAVLNQSWRF